MKSSGLKEFLTKAHLIKMVDSQITDVLTGPRFLLTWDEVARVLHDFREEKSETIQKRREERNHTPSVLNRSAVKQFALRVSEAKKCGKFNRVSAEFIKTIETELENILRQIGGMAGCEDDFGSEFDFLNRARICPKVVEVLNKAVRKIIFRRVCNHPSSGKTLR